MKKRELWLKLFSENKTALAVAIHLCEKYVTMDDLVQNKEFIEGKVAELDTIVPEEDIKAVFE